jgi:tRNA (guanine37-N1)-methyltransferase
MTERPFRVDVFTLFPETIRGPLNESILRRARDRGLIEIRAHDIRDWATGRHKSVDDTPYGGGAGMVMSAEPIMKAVEETLGERLAETKVVILSASGRRLTQRVVRELARSPRLALICGHYEGIDERVAELLGADQISIGDFVLTGGELPALVLIDAVSRLQPGVIDAESVREESHSQPRVEYPHYTRPAEYRGRSVPGILLGGNHAAIERWREEQSLRRTATWRPDLLLDED